MTASLGECRGSRWRWAAWSRSPAQAHCAVWPSARTPSAGRQRLSARPMAGGRANCAGYLGRQMQRYWDLPALATAAGLRSTEWLVLSGAMQRAHAAHRTRRLDHPQRGRGDLRTPARPDRGLSATAAANPSMTTTQPTSGRPRRRLTRVPPCLRSRCRGARPRGGDERDCPRRRRPLQRNDIHEYTPDHVYLALSCPMASTTVAVRPDRGARARARAGGAAKPHPEVIGARRTPSIRAHLLVSGDWGSFHSPTVRLRPIRHRPSNRLAPRTTLRTRSFRRRRWP